MLAFVFVCSFVPTDEERNELTLTTSLIDDSETLIALHLCVVQLMFGWHKMPLIRLDGDVVNVLNMEGDLWNITVNRDTLELCKDKNSSKKLLLSKLRLYFGHVLSEDMHYWRSEEEDGEGGKSKKTFAAPVLDAYLMIR